jgi:hypothetical protein
MLQDSGIVKNGDGIWLARIQALAGYVGMPGMWVRKISSEAADL